MAEWVVRDCHGEPRLLIEDKGQARYPTADEAARAAAYLNEQGSSTVTLYCRTDNCPGKGGWISRTLEDSKKNVYPCESGCRKPMVR